jgi:hypothetical protein
MTGEPTQSPVKPSYKHPRNMAAGKFDKDTAVNADIFQITENAEAVKTTPDARILAYCYPQNTSSILIYHLKISTTDFHFTNKYINTQLTVISSCLFKIITFLQGHYLIFQTS